MHVSTRRHAQFSLSPARGVQRGLRTKFCAVNGPASYRFLVSSGLLIGVRGKTARGVLSAAGTELYIFGRLAPCGEFGEPHYDTMIAL